MIFRYATYFLFAWAMLGSAVLLYFQNIDGIVINKPLTFYVDTQNFKTDKAVYHRGDTISILTSVCINRAYRGEVTWRLINETVVTFPTSYKVNSVGCLKDKVVAVGTIPPYAVEGTHHLEGSLALHINAINTQYMNFKSVNFEVQ